MRWYLIGLTVTDGNSRLYSCRWQILANGYSVFSGATLNVSMLEQLRRSYDFYSLSSPSKTFDLITCENVWMKTKFTWLHVHVSKIHVSDICYYIIVLFRILEEVQLSYVFYSSKLSIGIFDTPNLLTFCFFRLL